MKTMNAFAMACSFQTPTKRPHTQGVAQPSPNPLLALGSLRQQWRRVLTLHGFC